MILEYFMDAVQLLLFMLTTYQLFGPDEQEMDKVLKELNLQGFKLKIEKSGNNPCYNFLGINIKYTVDSNNNPII